MSDPLEEAIKRGNEIRPKFAGMAMVIAGLNHLDAMMQAVFWLSPNDRLDGARPIDLVEVAPKSNVLTFQEL